MLKKLKNTHIDNKMKYQPRKLPEGMTLGQMEEIFTDRLANLIVRLLDYRHEQKLNAQATSENKSEDKDKKHA